MTIKPLILLPCDLEDRFEVYMRERFPWFGVASEPQRRGSPRDRQLLTATKQWIGALTDDERQRVLDHWTNLAGAEHTARLAAVLQ
jgi:hypothetical protein